MVKKKNNLTWLFILAGAYKMVLRYNILIFVKKNEAKVRINPAKQVLVLYAWLCCHPIHEITVLFRASGQAQHDFCLATTGKTLEVEIVHLW